MRDPRIKNLWAVTVWHRPVTAVSPWFTLPLAAARSSYPPNGGMPIRDWQIGGVSRTAPNNLLKVCKMPSSNAVINMCI